MSKRLTEHRKGELKNWLRHWYLAARHVAKADAGLTAQGKREQLPAYRDIMQIIEEAKP